MSLEIMREINFIKVPEMWDPIPVSTIIYHVALKGQVLVAADLPNLVKILRLANKSMGVTSPQDIDRVLLGGHMSLNSHRLAAKCEDLGLLQCTETLNVFELTDIGRQAADQGFIMIPEQVLLQLWITADHLAPPEKMLYEIWAANERVRLSTNPPENMIPLPEWLHTTLVGKTVCFPKLEQGIVLARIHTAKSFVYNGTHRFLTIADRMEIL